MRLPLLEDGDGEGGQSGGSNGAGPAGGAGRPPRWFTLGHIESQQCALSSTMLSAAKGM